jgi:hypothetical protein
VHLGYSDYPTCFWHVGGLTCMIITTIITSTATATTIIIPIIIGAAGSL